MFISSEADIPTPWWERNVPILKLRIISLGAIMFFVIPWVVGMIVCLLFTIHVLLLL